MSKFVRGLAASLNVFYACSSRDRLRTLVGK